MQQQDRPDFFQIGFYAMQNAGEDLQAISVSELNAKAEAAANELYGEKGEKISAGIKQDYLEDNYFAFRQIFLANYYMKFATDENGDVIYVEKLDVQVDEEITFDKVVAVNNRTLKVVLCLTIKSQIPFTSLRTAVKTG